MFEKIILRKELISYLEERNLSKQYQKAKENILAGRLNQVDFKLRQPKKYGVYYFRINRQFRAFARKKGMNLEVFEIYDHKR